MGHLEVGTASGNKGGRDALARLLVALAAEDGLTDRLLVEFDCVGGVLAAPVERLERFCGARIAMGINAAYVANLSGALDALAGRPLLGSLAAVERYLRLWLANLTSERVIVIYLDARHGLIRLEETFRGTLVTAPLCPREITQRALELAAKSVILAHNHPSGDATPSMADQEATKRMATALALFEIELIDHLVIAREGTVSFRAEGLL